MIGVLDGKDRKGQRQFVKTMSGKFPNINFQ